MKAAILAAGIGSRLGEIGKNTPKCLLEIGNKTLLERQIEILNSCGIKKEDIIVVIGGNGDVWNEKNKEKIKKIHHNIIINNQNVEKNQSYSLWLVLQKVKEYLLCIDGDTIFKKEIIEKILNSEYSSVLLTRDGEKKEKRLRVSIKNNQVLEIGEEVKSERIYTPFLKLSPTFINALRQELKNGTHFDFTINIPINIVCKAYPIYNISIERRDWPFGLPTLNVNTPEEYQKAQKLFK